MKASLENAVNCERLTAFFYPFYPKEEHMTNEKFAKEEAILAKRKEQARKAKDAEKQQKRKLAKLKRDARTHQLCERGGELNRLLLRPDDLTDEQVKRFLQEVFALAAVQEKLSALLPPNLVEKVVQELESEQQEEPEEPAPKSQAKPPTKGIRNRPPSSPYQQNSPFNGRSGRKR
jgi:hypothetical protein